MLKIGKLKWYLVSALLVFWHMVPMPVLPSAYDFFSPICSPVNSPLSSNNSKSTQAIDCPVCTFQQQGFFPVSSLGLILRMTSVPLLVESQFLEVLVVFPTYTFARSRAPPF